MPRHRGSAGHPGCSRLIVAVTAGVIVGRSAGWRRARRMACSAEGRLGALFGVGVNVGVISGQSPPQVSRMSVTHRYCAALE